MDPYRVVRVEQKGDATRYLVVVCRQTGALCRSGTAASAIPSLGRTFFMHKIPLTVQRLILAFTTGLFLACAAHVSAQGDTIPLTSIEP
jgi:hypothetical protein